MCVYRLTEGYLKATRGELSSNNLPAGLCPEAKELSRHRAVVQVIPRRVREQASRDDRQPLRQAERVRVGARQRGRARLEPLVAAQEVEADRDARRRGRARRAAGAPVNRIATPCLKGQRRWNRRLWRRRARGPEALTGPRPFSLRVSSHPEPPTQRVGCPGEAPGPIMEAFGHAALRRPNRAREAPGPAPPAESATPQSRRGRRGVHGARMGCAEDEEGCGGVVGEAEVCGEVCGEVWGGGTQRAHTEHRGLLAGGG